MKKMSFSPLFPSVCFGVAYNICDCCIYYNCIWLRYVLKDISTDLKLVSLECIQLQVSKKFFHRYLSIAVDCISVEKKRCWSRILNDDTILGSKVINEQLLVWQPKIHRINLYCARKSSLLFISVCVSIKRPAC